MPTYQYACTNPDCGNRFELVQSFTDPAVHECPVCGLAVRKVYGSVGVVFKGSGFYRTDSRAAATASTDSKPKSGSQSKSDPKSEKKAEPAAASNGSSGFADGSSTSASGSGSSTKAAASA